MFFAEGLDVVLHKYPTGKLALDGLLAGEIDVATVAETPVMFNSQEYLFTRITPPQVTDSSGSKGMQNSPRRWTRGQRGRG